MRLHVLDTDTLTLYQFANPVVVQKVRAHSGNEIAITVITVEEQLSGWYTQLRRVKGADHLARVYQRLTDNVKSLAQFQILSFNQTSIARYAELQKQKLRIRKVDLRIAAIALNHGAVLVTCNRMDFDHVPGLEIQDWTTVS